VTGIPGPQEWPSPATATSPWVTFPVSTEPAARSASAREPCWLLAIGADTAPRLREPFRSADHGDLLYSGANLASDGTLIFEQEYLMVTARVPARPAAAAGSDASP
jgi:hypothetical protein